MNDRKFEIRCNAGPDGQLHVKSQALSLAVSQMISRNGAQEFWQSLLILCEENEDGSVSTKVIVCHPDWDQNLQIASIQSRISNIDRPASILEVNLKSVHV
jgi:hypothetical protein